MGQIHLENMEFFAYHGHLEEEQIIGNTFLVDLMLETDMEKPAKTDELDDALDYQKAYQIIQHEMTQNSCLLEHVAQRILNSLYQTLKEKLDKATVKVSKLNPPVGGKVGKVSVTLSK